MNSYESNDGISSKQIGENLKIDESIIDRVIEKTSLAFQQLIGCLVEEIPGEGGSYGLTEMNRSRARFLIDSYLLS